jgi:hypothetical protein
VISRNANSELLATLKALLREGWWVDRKTYLAERPGETRDAVYTRRSKGIWRDGVECKLIKGAGLWIDLIAVNKWAAEAKCETRPGAKNSMTAARR